MLLTLLMSRIRTLVGCISILQLPRNLIKFWQLYIKPLIVTYQQSGTELVEVSQPEAFEVGPVMIMSNGFADNPSMVSIIF